MGTNKPVKITDAKSGLIRRLIDVSPSGEKLSPKEYKHAVKQVGFELGPIAHHCQEVYLSEPGRYDDYIPIKWASLECKKSANAAKQPNQEYYVDLMDNMSFSRFVYPENKEEVLSELQSAFRT